MVSSARRSYLQEHWQEHATFGGDPLNPTTPTTQKAHTCDRTFYLAANDGWGRCYQARSPAHPTMSHSIHPILLHTWIFQEVSTVVDRKLQRLKNGC